MTVHSIRYAFRKIGTILQVREDYAEEAALVVLN
jgi:hypothetical protein